MYKTKLEWLILFISYQKAGSLIAVGGRPAIGKTAFFLNLIEWLCCEDKKCLYLSDNESKEKLVQRLTHQAIGLDYYKDLSKQEMEIVAETIKNISEWKLFLVSNNSGFTYCEIEQLLQEQKPDYIFIDFKTAPKSLKTLKNLAEKYQAVIFISTNLKKSPSNRTGNLPILEDLKSYKRIAKYADEVLLLHRPYYYDCTISEEWKNTLYVIYNKTSDKKLMLDFSYKTGRID